MPDTAAVVSAAQLLLESLEPRDRVQLLKTVLGPRFEDLQAIVDWAIPDIVYAPSTALTHSRCRGIISSFEEEGDKRSGTIECKDIKDTFNCDVLLNGDQLPRCKVKVGDEVSFAILLDTEKDHMPRAFDVVNHSIPEKGRGKKGEGKGKEQSEGKGKEQTQDPDERERRALERQQSSKRSRSRNRSRSRSRNRSKGKGKGDGKRGRPRFNGRRRDDKGEGKGKGRDQRGDSRSAAEPRVIEPIGSRASRGPDSDGQKDKGRTGMAGIAAARVNAIKEQGKVPGPRVIGGPIGAPNVPRLVPGVGPKGGPVPPSTPPPRPASVGPRQVPPPIRSASTGQVIAPNAPRKPQTIMPIVQNVMVSSAKASGTAAHPPPAIGKGGGQQQMASLQNFAQGAMQKGGHPQL